MKYKDIKGQRFGYLTVIQRSPRRNAKQQMYWICRCDCGRYLVVRGDSLRRGEAVHCSVCRGDKAGRLSRFIEEGDIHEWTV